METKEWCKEDGKKIIDKTWHFMRVIFNSLQIYGLSREIIYFFTHFKCLFNEPHLLSAERDLPASEIV